MVRMDHSGPASRTAALPRIEARLAAPDFGYVAAVGHSAGWPVPVLPAAVLGALDGGGTRGREATRCYRAMWSRAAPESLGFFFTLRVERAP